MLKMLFIRQFPFQHIVGSYWRIVHDGSTISRIGGGVIHHFLKGTPRRRRSDLGSHDSMVIDVWCKLKHKGNGWWEMLFRWRMVMEWMEREYEDEDGKKDGGWFWGERDEDGCVDAEAKTQRKTKAVLSQILWDYVTSQARMKFYPWPMTFEASPTSSVRPALPGTVLTFHATCVTVPCCQ